MRGKSSGNPRASFTPRQLTGPPLGNRAAPHRKERWRAAQRMGRRAGRPPGSRSGRALEAAAQGQATGSQREQGEVAAGLGHSGHNGSTIEEVEVGNGCRPYRTRQLSR